MNKLNIVTTRWLTLILGGVGAHRFYLRQYGYGILYLVFFWTWIPLIISFFDLFIFLTMKDEKFDELYNSNSSNTQRNIPIFDNKPKESLKDYYELYKIGAITEEEYNKKKAELL